MRKKREIFVLVDSIGPDELRLTYDGIQLSKENLRNFYRETSWYQALEKAKIMASELGEEDWKKICIETLGEEPPSLDASVLKKASMIYKTLGQELFQRFLGKDLYPDSWTLDQLVESWKN